MKIKFDKLDIGCGRNKREGFIGIDIYDFTNVYPKGKFICADISKGIPAKDNSCDHIISDQLLEHIPKDRFIGFMNECYRVLVRGGIFEARFPPAITEGGFPNPGFHADPLHVNGMILGTFACFSAEFRKQTLKAHNLDYASYGITTDFVMVSGGYSEPTQLSVVLVKES